MVKAEEQLGESLDTKDCVQVYNLARFYKLTRLMKKHFESFIAVLLTAQLTPNF